MNKLWLIIRREYLTRVKTKSFILTTILTPVAMLVFMAVVGVIFSYSGGDTKILIKDESNLLEKIIKDEQNLHFSFTDEPLEKLRNGKMSSGFDGLLYIPKLEDSLAKEVKIYYYSDGQLGLDVTSQISNSIEDRIKEYKIKALKLDKTLLESLNFDVTVEPEPLDPKAKNDVGNNPSSFTNAIAAGIGFVMGFVMYLAVFIYGMMIMRSVMEEKTSRIVEVMISSVKPFQLMMGKIIGVGAVGLTQAAIWAILIPIINLIAPLLLGIDVSSSPANMPGDSTQFSSIDMNEQISILMNELGNQSWGLIIPLFVIFFLGGYVLYSSLFAAVGSAMGDDIGESQSLTLPISLPVILAVYIMMVVIRQPESNLAVWSSIFPLFSPIVMPARLAFHPPMWQVALSVVLLIATAIFFVWISGRIYRIGILMYGKKVTFREISKWIFYKN